MSDNKTQDEWIQCTECGAQMGFYGTIRHRGTCSQHPQNKKDADTKTMEQEFRESSPLDCCIWDAPTLYEFSEFLKEKVTALRAKDAEQAKRIAELENKCVEWEKWYRNIGELLESEREKNKRPDCMKCVRKPHQDYCIECQWNGVDNYKEKTT